MQEENQNSKVDWRARVSQLDAIEGEQKPDLQAPWAKLEQRLQMKEERRNPILYWLAAAAILAAIFIPVAYVIFKGHVDKNNTVNVNLIRDMSTHDIVKTEISASSDKNEIYRRLTKFTSRLNKTNIRISKNLTTQNTIKSNTIINPANSITAIQEETDSSTTMIVEQPNQSPAFEAPAKKLRVLHINQLVYPTEKEIMVRNTDPNLQKNPSRIRLSDNSNDNILNINLSPTN